MADTPAQVALDGEVKLATERAEAAERRLAEQGQAQDEAVAYVSRCDLFSPSGLPIKAERRPTDTKNFPLYATPPSPEPDAELVEALLWYENNVAGCRLIHSGGDAHRNALAEDGGRRAAEALRRHRKQGGA